MPICLVNHARWWMIWSELSDQIIHHFLQKKLTPRCEFLLNEGCKVNHFDTGSESPIFYFERNGQSWCRKHWCGVPQMCRSLEQPRLMQRRRFPLHECGLLQTLIQHHADLDVIDKPGLSPFSWGASLQLAHLGTAGVLSFVPALRPQTKRNARGAFFLEWIEDSNELRLFEKMKFIQKGTFEELRRPLGRRHGVVIGRR